VRSDDELSVGERAADGVRDALGSWPVLVLAVTVVGVGICVAVSHGDRTATVLGLVLAGIAVVELLLVLMAARRADKVVGELALDELESIRRAAAGIHEVRDEVVQVRADLARLVARLNAQRESAR
jgi:uncharacterized membrane protein